MTAPEAGSEHWADRQPAAVPWDGSRRLWSLWEMLELEAGAFTEAVTAVSMLHRLVDQMNNAPANVKGEPIGADDGIRTAAIHTTMKLREHCVVLNATTSIVVIDKLLNFLNSSQGGNYYHTASDLLLYIIRVVPDELRGRTLLP